MTVFPPLINEDIVHFSLAGLLPETRTLAINKVVGAIILMDVVKGHAYALYTNTVTQAELPLLLVAFEYYPYYIPYEVIHAAATYGSLTDERIERSREQLAEANDYMLWDQVMRPVRNALSRARGKLRPCGLDIVSILETGYLLRAAREGRHV